MRHRAPACLARGPCGSLPAAVPVRLNPEKPSGQPSRDGSDWTRALRDAAPYLGIGTTMAATVLLCVGGGYWIDARLETRPIFFLLGGAFGLFAALYNFTRAVTRRKP